MFILFAGVAVIGALNLLLRRHPLHSALSLLVTMGAIAGLYVMLGAYFIAAVQVLIYAGAIMVLFLFVIMLLNVGSGQRPSDRRPYFKWLAIPLAVVLMGQIFYILGLFRTNPAPVGDKTGLTEEIGKELFTSFMLPFEATSILILVAIIGAMVLAGKE